MANRDEAYKVALVENGLDDAADEGGAVDELFVLRHRNELVHQWLSLDDIV